MEDENNMCLGVFLGTDKPQSLVKWDEANPAFNVTELSEFEQPVSKQFDKKHIYYLGAYTGCSCGFWPDSDEGPIGSQQSLNELFQYVSHAAQDSGVEIFVCWEGDWAEEPTKTERISIQELRDPEKWLKELQKTIVGAPHNQAL